MDSPPGSRDVNMSDQHIVHADEIDQTGADITTVSDEQLMPEVGQGLQAEQQQQHQNQQQDNDAPPADSSEEFPDFAQLPSHVKEPVRPELRHGSVAPPPPLKPPPPAPLQPNLENNPTDSLSLAQLKRIVQDMPKIETPAYAFEYADTQPFPDEINEWFQYNETDRLMLLGSHASFAQHWATFSQPIPGSDSSDFCWLLAGERHRTSFIGQVLASLDNPDLLTRIEGLEIICYILTGDWWWTAGEPSAEHEEEDHPYGEAEYPRNKSLQISCMERDALLLQRCSGIPVLYNYLRKVFDKDLDIQGEESRRFEAESGSAAYHAARAREANLILTCFYMLVELARRQAERYPSEQTLKNEIAALKPNLLVFLVEIIARLRWDDSTNVPLTRTILLFWKCLLLLFGGSKDLERTKTALEPKYDGSSTTSAMPLLTASPLDYHIFRQEITSKYPAYNPPPPLFPIEPENTSILPPLPTHTARYNPSGIFPGMGPSSTGGNGSILNQSVHIATPAPSPPPSPIGPGGKAGKKHNYQTNQHFPFMYPPLDESSNDIGGRGSGSMQDSLVGKRWEGSDVPASIIEAGQLFSSRMKMTRAIRQLWEERERFMRYDRGWDAREPSGATTTTSATRFGEDVDMDDAPRDKHSAMPSTPTKETDDEDVQKRLDAVEDFYSQAMPNLQSVVIVLLKEILVNITETASQANAGGQNGHGPSSANVNHAGTGSQDFEGEGLDVQELDTIRQREISAKAISGVLLLMLKWFKRSHILKFEYMTQLLLDSNYLPLILKMFIHHDVDRAVAQRNDRDDLSFWRFCYLHCDDPPPDPLPDPIPRGPRQSDSEDEAVPPPIARTRSQPSTLDPSAPSGSTEITGDQQQQHPSDSSSGYTPEVDELGHPTGATLPPNVAAPITTFSFRNFFSAINFLHIMQKITRDKAHRCLLLVQYKASNILRKGIKIPDPHLRLYTLKLFKSQVPYCGRKWRQTHMRIITAIYLYCRPELRDDWLVGSDVDAEVEESLPMEQALRGLTHWWHLRRYKNAMAIEEGSAMLEEERDFFARELESMGWGMGGEDMFGGGAGEDGGAQQGVNGTEWDGAPMQMEGM
ncbi:hypothetical protein AJ80_04913 [Polytolypa hystricis UAMH7299]|uniref:Far11/STRP C-terminal domain-containing protein n=1 Tax=Polytolypa hystricis (strain UAMH7299) TaxID=1447883 RepID=A0A2B7Y889_POLH7|nr:hypothetical protein AJ80_04913 [Polytolypa hystricis UAMH7299]